MAYCRTHTSSGASYRERNRSRKHPERTNGTPRCASVCVLTSAAFGEQALKDRASERNASEARSSDSVRSTGLSSVRPQPDGTRERNESSNKPPTKRQPVINQASTDRQPSVNGTSTGHQRNVNGTSNRRFSRRDTKEIHFGNHQRTAQSGLVDQHAVSGYAGRADLSGLNHQQRGRETCRAARPVVPRGLLGSGVQDSFDANATVRSVAR